MPVPDGVPLITPAADRVSPAGSEPVARDHVFEPVPPVAVKACEYGMLGAPFGSDTVVIVSTALTVIVRACCFV